MFKDEELDNIGLNDKASSMELSHSFNCMSPQAQHHFTRTSQNISIWEGVSLQVAPSSLGSALMSQSTPSFPVHSSCFWIKLHHCHF